MFGKPLVDDARKKPFPISGVAAIDARCGANWAFLSKNYSELVVRTVKNIGARAKAGQAKLTDGSGKFIAGLFIEELKREIADKTQQPHPGFLWDLKAAKHISIFPIFVYDVASALGLPVGVEIGKTTIDIYLCGRGVEVKETHLLVGDAVASDRDANAPVYDMAQLQSSLYAIAADEKRLGLELDASLALYRKAIAICPENADARCGMASAFSELGKYEEALAEAMVAISLEPYSGRAHEQAGLALARMGDDYGAMERFAEAAEFAGTAAKRSAYLYNLAVSQFNVGQLNDAKNSCTSAIRNDPGNADAYRLRGQINLDLGLARQADEDMRAYERLTGKKGNP